jgi:hypothetical protein
MDRQHFPSVDEWTDDIIPFVPVSDLRRSGMGTTSDRGEACDPWYAVEVGVGAGQVGKVVQLHQGEPSGRTLFFVFGEALGSTFVPWVRKVAGTVV